MRKFTVWIERDYSATERAMVRVEAQDAESAHLKVEDALFKGELSPSWRELKGSFEQTGGPRIEVVP
jgi:hypothetical protein